jgi:proline dehydrogenase
MLIESQSCHRAAVIDTAGTATSWESQTQPRSVDETPARHARGSPEPLTFIISIMSTYFNRDEELEAYLQRYNDDCNDQEQLSEEINAVFEFIQKCSFTDGSRAWKKADLLTLLVEVHRALYKAKEKIKASRVSSAIKQFYQQVGKMSDLSDSRGTRDAIAYEYYQAALQATNDRSSRITRGKIIKKIINDVPS